MERKNSGVWIIVVAVLAVVFCCACAAATGAIAWVATWSSGWEWSGWESSDWESSGLEDASDEDMARTFEVGENPELDITNFSGSIRIRAGESGEIRVEATKKVKRHKDLHRIEIDMGERDGAVVVKTRKTMGLDDASVELLVTAPANTRLDVQTGAGAVDVRGLAGDLDVDTGAGAVILRDTRGRVEVNSGAGTVEVRNASGPVEVGVGAGTILYEGTLEGDSSFSTGIGEIVLRLPQELDAKVDLSTGIGGVDVRYDVTGTVSPRKVRGVIGDGSQGSIYAHTGAGHIEVKRQ